MAKKQWVVDPQRFVETTKVGLTALPAEDVALIQTLIGDHLQSSPTPASRELIPHIAEHFTYIYPALMADPRAADCLHRLNAAFGVVDPPPETDQSSGPRPEFPWAGAVVLGAGAAAILGYYGLEALASYCGDVHPLPGESASVKC
ncbi:hypothetical protein [Mycobacterium sp.]|uniref:hypothetical protein n=1 Tax=Mycobacterium sp. TaxID=1785 RepID=UPI003F9590B0